MKKYFLSFLAYVALTGVAYGPSLRYAFVYDDLPRILQNELIKQPVSVKAAFLNPQLQSSLPELNTHTYRPLLSLTLWVDYRLFGTNPAPYRLQNFLFHVLSTSLVCLLGQILFSMSLGGAFTAGALFLLHPTQIESVVWISELSNPACLFFLLLATLFWTKRKLLPTFVSFLVALFYRESAVCFPFLMLMTTLLIRRDRIRDDLRPIGASISVIVLFLIARNQILGTVAQTQLYGGNFFTNFLTAVSIVPTMLQTLLLPYPQSVQHELPVVTQLFHSQVLLGILVVAFVTIVIGSFWKKDQRVSFVLAGLFFFWVPTSNIVPLTHLFNERWLYPLMIFYAWLLAILLERGYDRISRPFSKISGAAILLLYLLLIRSYLPVWANNQTLWAHAVKINPESWFSHYCLGVAQRDAAQQTKDPQMFWNAGQSFGQALARNPSRFYAPGIWLHLAEVNLYLNAPEQAAHCAQEAIAIDPLTAEEWSQLQQRFSINHKL